SSRWTCAPSTTPQPASRSTGSMRLARASASVSCVACIAPLALRADRQDKRSVDHRQVTIQRHVAPRIASDQQFAAVIAGRATYQRIVRQHVEGADDLLHARRGVLDLVLVKMLDDPVQV